MISSVIATFPPNILVGSLILLTSLRQWSTGGPVCIYAFSVIGPTVWNDLTKELCLYS